MSYLTYFFFIETIIFSIIVLIFQNIIKYINLYTYDRGNNNKNPDRKYNTSDT